MSDEEIIQAIAKTLGQPPRAVRRLPGGANNVVVRADSHQGTILVKFYFTHAEDLRDRLGTEFNTLTFLWTNGVRCVPEPLALDRAQNLGVYRYIEGQKPAVNRIKFKDVQQLALLLGEMWAIRTRPGAQALPNASEAHFSLRNYRDHVSARLARVELALESDSIPMPVREFARMKIRPAMDTVDRFLDTGAIKYGIDLEVELPDRFRTISPADHGFHNCLRTSQNQLVFLDFEYAGWDQPAQMLANACLQPEVPMPPDFLKPFIRDMLGRLRDDDCLLYRLRLIYPLLSLKWSLIMLNEFLPVSGQRRAFAGANADARREAQFAKSQRQLQAALEAASAGFFLDELIDEFNPLP